VTEVAQPSSTATTMSEENVSKQKFEIAQWPTSKVILYPTQAMIFRDIEGVQLKVHSPYFLLSLCVNETFLSLV